MKKAPITVAFVLVAGLFAAAFSLAPAVAQYTPPSDSTGTSSNNTTSTSNTTNPSNTTGTTTNGTGGGIFSARGSIATLLFDTGEITTTSEVQNETTGTASNDSSMTAGNATTSSNTTTSLSDNTTLPQIMTGVNSTSSSNMTGSTGNVTGTGNMTSTTSNEKSAAEAEKPYVLSGDWNLDVRDGNVTDFAANFTMVHIDGTSRHTHDLSNFVSSNSTTIDTSKNGTSFIFGTVDVAVNGEPKWTGVDALIIIEKNNVVSISLATEDTEDHFMGQPIYGITNSMTDENGNEMIKTGDTQTAGNVTNETTSGNQTAGEFLGNVTQGIKDFFNGTEK